MYQIKYVSFIKWEDKEEREKYGAEEDYECIDGSCNGTEHPGTAGAGGTG